MNEHEQEVQAIATETERAAAAKRAREKIAAVQFELRVRRLAATGQDDGNGNCRRCGKPFDYDDEGRAMHAEPLDACPLNPPPTAIPPRLQLVKDDDKTETIQRPVRAKPFGERDDD